MKYEYTYAELKNEMSVLENTFSIVRLVDPIICRVVHVTLQNDKLIFSPTSPCYQVWNRSQQCANCISARTLRSGQACTKFECIENQVFQIICRYILLENTKLILEMGTDITAFVLDSRKTKEEIQEGIRDLNHKMVTDPVTQAYRPHYIEEHLLHTAMNTGNNPYSFHLALIGIDGLEEIRKNSGHLACDGILRAAADSIRKYLHGEDTGAFLALYNEDTFLFAAGSDTHEELKEKLLKVIHNAPAVPILFGEKPLSLQLCAGLITCTSPELIQKDRLINTLDSLREKAGQLPLRLADRIIRPAQDQIM